jgi:hypothetical protein
MQHILFRSLMIEVTETTTVVIRPGAMCAEPVYSPEIKTDVQPIQTKVRRRPIRQPGVAGCLRRGQRRRAKAN